LSEAGSAIRDRDMAAGIGGVLLTVPVIYLLADPPARERISQLKYLLLWGLGVPIPVLIIGYLIFH
jgi:hypothetical protein